MTFGIRAQLQMALVDFGRTCGAVAVGADPDLIDKAALRVVELLYDPLLNFTWKDVETLEDVVRSLRRQRLEGGGSRHGNEVEVGLEDLADRIAALLRSWEGMDP
jgi:hypothetical protein